MNTPARDIGIKKPTAKPTETLTETIQSKLSDPASTSDFDLHGCVNEVLKNVGLTAADSGGKLSFYGQDPIIASPHRFGAMAAVTLAARSVALASLRKSQTGEGQDIAVDVRKAFRRFCGFFEGKWETVNGRPPATFEDPLNPFITSNLFYETRDERHVVAINIYPKLAARALSLLRCGTSADAVRNAIQQWRADDLENAAVEAGLPIIKVRTFEEFQKERQYTEVLSRMPLIKVEKIGESEPIPFKKDAKSPLDGIRAVGMGHVIAGACMGRDLAYHGADVINVWRPTDSEIESFVWDVQVGMRQAI